jgi:hypothetical protein
MDRSLRRGTASVNGLEHAVYPQFISEPEDVDSTVRRLARGATGDFGPGTSRNTHEAVRSA